MSRHDHSYRLLFSQPELVADLLRGFVHEPWVDELDFSTLTPVKTDFISRNLAERRNDCLWQMQWRSATGDHWLYLYLMLEFQSRPDHWMPVRIMTYLGLLYQNLIQAGELRRTSLLPPVLPVVLYNGRARWRSPLDIQDLLPAVPPGLKSYLPQHRFLLIDETDYRNAALPETRNFAAALFRLEYSMTPESITDVLGRLLDWLNHEDQQETRRAFASWMKHVLLPERMKGLHLDGMDELQEMHSMLEETVKEWRREARRKGKEEGREQGREEGREKGREEGRKLGQLETDRATLRRQIQLKFGEVPDWTAPLIDNADLPQLEAWLDAIITADTLDFLKH